MTMISSLSLAAAAMTGCKKFSCWRSGRRRKSEDPHHEVHRRRDKRNTKSHAALAAAHLTAAGDTITIGTNVLDHAFALTISAQVVMPGEVAVSAAKLGAIAGSFPGNSNIN